MSGPELWSVADTARRVKAGEIKAVEIVDAMLARIEKHRERAVTRDAHAHRFGQRIGGAEGDASIEPVVRRYLQGVVVDEPVPAALVDAGELRDRPQECIGKRCAGSACGIGVP